MSKEEIILKYKNGEKSIKVLFIIYTDMESLLERIETFHNDPEKSYSFWWFITYALFIWCHKKTSMIITDVKIVWKTFIEI